VTGSYCGFGPAKYLASCESVVNRSMDSYRWPNATCMVFAVYQPVQPFLPLDFACHFEVQKLVHLPVLCGHLWCVLALVGQKENLKVVTKTESSLKGNKLMHIVCKIYMHAYFSWQVTVYWLKIVINIILKFLMCDLNWFSKILSHIISAENLGSGFDAIFKDGS